MMVMASRRKNITSVIHDTRCIRDVLILSELFSLSRRGIPYASEDYGSTLLYVDNHAKIKSYNAPTPVSHPHHMVPGPSDASIVPLLEGVRPGAPPGQEGCQPDGLECLGNDGNTDGIQGTLLLEHLDNELRITTC